MKVLHRLRDRRVATFCGCTLLSMPVTATFAADDEAPTLQEVIVTAQKRSENVQQVPIAITAFSAEALAQKGVTDVADISSFTPNVQIDRSSAFAGSSTILSAYIRGIGQSDFAFNMEPGVGLYVDGVYYARTVGAAIDLMDVARVEVLKGPQGTLFGRNTIGGALHVITRKPGREFAYQGEVQIGDYNRRTFRGAFDIPLIDGLLYSSVSFASTQRDGYQKRIPFNPAVTAAVNPITGATYTGSTFQTDSPYFVHAQGGISGSDTQGGLNSQTARLKVLFTPSDDLEVLLSGDVTNAREESTPMTLLKTYISPGTLFGLVYNSCIGGVDPSVVTGGGLPPGMCSIKRGTVGTSLASVSATRLPFGDHFITGNVDTTYATGSNFSDVKTYGFSGTFDWKLNDTLSLKSISAYRNLQSKFGTDTDASPEDMVDTSFTMNQKQLSEELQLNINGFSKRLKSVVGAYYFTEKGGLLDTVVFAGGLLQVYGPNDFKNDALAAFTHNTFAVTDKLGLTLGARYTEETKYFTGGQSDRNDFVNRYLGVPAFLFPDPNNTTILFPLGRNKQVFNNTSVRAGTQYQLTPDIMTYVSFAQGYKSGGWTTRLAVPLAVSAGAGAPIDPTKPPTFAPEKANTYEAGVKTELLGRRLRMNTAVFRTDYKDMQIVSAPAFSFGAPWFFNAGEARIQGAEVETDAKIAAGLTVNASLGYLDAKYTKLADVALAGGLTKDDMLMNVPKWSANAGGTYSIPLPNQREFSMHADYVYKSRMARDSLNTPDLISSSFGILNSSLNYGSQDGHWQVTLGGENLTDKRYLLSGNNNSAVGVISGTYNVPRMWYLGVKVRS
ncbi:MAG: TonB-dependent receptor [Steroidobacteraceae bacterium]